MSVEELWAHLQCTLFSAAFQESLSTLSTYDYSHPLLSIVHGKKFVPPRKNPVSAPGGLNRKDLESWRNFGVSRKSNSLEELGENFRRPSGFLTSTERLACTHL